MGNFYSGFGWGKSFLGHCDDGIIYSGSGNSTPIGRYEDGNIYNGFKKNIGSYCGGSIYDAFGTHIASYDNGIVYNKYSNAAFGREQVGSYEDNPAEAAALVLLFLGGNAINSNDEDRSDPEPSPTPSPSADSDTGCLGASFSLIGLVIFTLPKLLFYYYKFMFLYFIFPAFSAATAYFWGALILIVAVFPAAIPFLGAIEPVLIAISLPYWIILFKQKRKRKMKWKETFKYYGKWLIKGPWAYKDIIELKKSPMCN